MLMSKRHYCRLSTINHRQQGTEISIFKLGLAQVESATFSRFFSSQLCRSCCTSYLVKQISASLFWVVYYFPLLFLSLKQFAFGKAVESMGHKSIIIGGLAWNDWNR